MLFRLLEKKQHYIYLSISENITDYRNVSSYFGLNSLLFNNQWSIKFSNLAAIIKQHFITLF